MKKRQRDFSIVLGIILAVLLIIPIVREPYLIDDGFKALTNLSGQKVPEDSDLKGKKRKR